MKFTGKFMAVVCLLAAIGVGTYLVRTNVKASTTSTNLKPFASAEYLITNSGITFGTESSPLQFTQAAYNGSSISVGAVTVGDETWLDGLEVSLKNVSPQEITFAQLRIDVLDSQNNQILATAAGLTIKKPLGSGQELSGKVSKVTAAELGRSLPNFSIASQRLLVQVDVVKMANGTMWRYGLLHRQDPNAPGTWWPNTIPITSNNFKARQEPSLALLLPPTHESLFSLYLGVI